MRIASPLKIALAGAGAFGEKHLDGLNTINRVEITSIISRTGEQAAAVAAKYGARHSATELEGALARDGLFNIQQIDVQTYFFRRRNINAKGEARSWTDHLLWHHAAHTVDLFAYQAGRIVAANAIEAPHHPELGIAMDMSIQLKSETGAICTLSLSFNNDAPLGTFFGYIGDTETYIARYDDLFTGKEEPIDVSRVAVSMNGIELQDREFIAAIREGREPNFSVSQVLDCYRVLGDLEKQLEAAR